MLLHRAHEGILMRPRKYWASIGMIGQDQRHGVRSAAGASPEVAVGRDFQNVIAKNKSVDHTSQRACAR